MSGNNVSICPITILCLGAVSAMHFVNAAGATAGVGENTIGVAAQTGQDESITVDHLGFITVEAGGVVTANNPVASDATGRAVNHTSGAIVGRALDSGIAGERVRVALIPN